LPRGARAGSSGLFWRDSPGCLTAAGGGWLAIHWLGGGLPGLFLAITLSLVVFGTTVAVATRVAEWRPARLDIPSGHRRPGARAIAITD